MANEEQLAIIKQGVEVWNQWRKDNPDIDVDLRKADLSGIDLSTVNLGRAALNRAVLSRADLSLANLKDADLRYADLSNRTRLDLGNRTRLDLSNRTRLDLQKRKIAKNRLQIYPNNKAYGANLRGANLRGANLEGCRMGYTSLDNIDLSETLGLEWVLHDRPSTIGIDTLYLSKGKIPDVFLRGCGVPETLIIYKNALMENALDFYSCFISYSHADKAFAKRLYDKLQGQGIRCWLDEHEMLPGDDFYREIDTGVRLWDKLLLCCSEASLKAWWIDHEVRTAFSEEQTLMKNSGGEKLQKVIPLNLDDFLFKGEGIKLSGGLVTQIKERLAANFVGWKDHDVFEREIQKVIRALRTDGGKAPPPKPKLGNF